MTPREFHEARCAAAGTTPEEMDKGTERINVVLGILAALCGIACLATDGWVSWAFGILAILTGIARFIPVNNEKLGNPYA